MIEAVLFDKDGTLIDFDATWGRATFEVLNGLADGDANKLEKLAEVTRYDLEQKKIHHTSALVGDSPMELAVLWADILGRASGSVFERQIDQMFTGESLKQLVGFDATGPALEHLRASGYHLGIATNDAEETANLHMQQLGWHGYFAHIFGYNSGHGPKPGGGMILAFASELGIQSSAVAMIGDSLHDIEAGKAAGAYTIGVRTGPWGGRGLEARADAVIDTLGELPDLLEKLSLQTVN